MHKTLRVMALLATLGSVAAAADSMPAEGTASTPTPGATASTPASHHKTGMKKKKTAKKPKPAPAATPAATPAPGTPQ